MGYKLPREGRPIQQLFKQVVYFPMNHKNKTGRPGAQSVFESILNINMFEIVDHH